MRVLQEDPEHFPALTLAVLSLIELKQIKKARAATDRLQTLAADNWRTGVVEARLLVASNRRRRAVEVATAALELAPADPLAYASVAEVAAVVSGKASLARRAAERALVLDPHATRPRLVLARLCVLRVDYEAAILHYEDLLQSHPDHDEALLGLAECQRLAGRRSDANQSYQRLVETNSELINDKPLGEPTPISAALTMRQVVLSFVLAGRSCSSQR